MATEAVIYTILYFLLAVCVVFPPKEFIASGLTIQHVFGNLLKSEEFHFIQYHIRRTTLTVIIHSLLPLGFFIGLARLTANNDAFHLDSWTSVWSLCLLSSALLSLGALTLAYSWFKDGWKGHPIARTLAFYSKDRPWHTVAADVNVEFRQIDKFASTANTLSRVIVTNSWVILITSYYVRIVHQSDIRLSMLSSEEHHISHVGNMSGLQVLTIRIETIPEEMTAFTIRLNSLEFSDFKEKLRAPIRNARNIVIHQTLSDRFVEAFKAQVQENPRHYLPENPEQDLCIGCMQQVANIKLKKLCDVLDVGVCVNCYCRPMWCIDCMGKWFASRQDQSQTDTWLSSKAPCPTCRSTFCMLDVCLVE